MSQKGDQGLAWGISRVTETPHPGVPPEAHLTPSGHHLVEATMIDSSILIFSINQSEGPVMSPTPIFAIQFSLSHKSSQKRSVPRGYKGHVCEEDSAIQGDSGTVSGGSLALRTSPASSAQWIILRGPCPHLQYLLELLLKLETDFGFKRAFGLPVL